MEFDDKNVEQEEAEMTTASQQPQPPVTTTQSSISYSRPRRSGRVVQANYGDSARSTSERRMHRTQSGGVASRNSSKSNARRQSTSNRTELPTASPTAETLATSPNDTNGDESMNVNNTTVATLPSDQSDDEILLSNTMRRTILSNERLNTNVMSRNEVLSYFQVKPEGFQCKLCNKVIIKVTSYVYIVSPLIREDLVSATD